MRRVYEILPKNHAVIATLALDYINGSGPDVSSEEAFGTCREISARAFFDRLWYPALLARCAAENQRFSQLIDFAQTLPALQTPTPDLAKDFAENLFAPPVKLSSELTLQAWPLIRHVLAASARSYPKGDWCCNFAGAPLERLVRHVYRGKEQNDEEVAASRIILSSVLRSRSVPDFYRAQAGLVSHFFSVTRGVDFVSPLTLTQDKTIIRMHVLDQPDETVSFPIRCAYPFFPLLADLHPDNRFLQNPSRLIEMVFQASPGLADVVLELEQIHAASSFSQGAGSYTIHFMGVIAAEQNEKWNKAGLALTCAFASDQSCVEFGRFLQDRDQKLPPELSARLSKIALDTSLQEKDKLNTSAPRKSVKM